MARQVIARHKTSTVYGDVDRVLGILSSIWITAARHPITVRVNVAGVEQVFVCDADQTERSFALSPPVTLVATLGLDGLGAGWRLPANSFLSVAER
jgi:hypothetical protein